MTRAPNDWVPFGTHRLRVEPPDVMHVVWNGRAEPEHLLALLEHIESVGQPRLFMVNDLTCGAAPTEEGRKLLAKDERLRVVHAMVCIGASYPVRGMMNLLVRANRFFQNGKGVKLVFFQEEAEARDWLEAQRLRVSATSPA